MARHPLAFGEALHRLGAHPHVQLLAHQLIRHAVVVAFDLDVIVDVHPCLLPLGVGETLGGQRSKSRLLEALEQRSPAAGTLAKRPLVQRAQKLANRLVELAQREKRPVPQTGQNPALNQLHASFDFGLVARLAHPGRHHRHAVVHGQVLIGRVQLRLVPARPSHSRTQVVRDHQLRHTATELQGPHMRTDPVGQTLAPRRLREGVAAGAPHRHEHLRLPHLARARVDHRHRRAAIVDEQLLSGPVHLAHAQVQLATPRPVQVAEPAVLVTIRMLLPILLPDQGKRHVPTLELLVHRRPVRLRTLGLHRRSAGRRIQPALQLLPAQALPRLQQASLLRPLDILRHARPPDSTRPTGLPLAQAAHQQ